MAATKANFRKPPLDLMMISGYLRKEGFDNTLLDANASKRTIDDVTEIIRQSSPDAYYFFDVNLHYLSRPDGG